jgi:hypothetical protein
LLDLDGVARDRDQLWAEAAAVEATGEPLTIPSELWGAAIVEQRGRVSHDAWEDILARHLAELRDDKVKDGAYWVGVNDSGGLEWRVASSYLLGPFVLAIGIERQTVAVTKRLAEVMRTLGCKKPNSSIRVGNAIRRAFTKAIAEAKAKDVEIVEPKAIAEVEPKKIAVRKPWLRPL